MPGRLQVPDAAPLLDSWEKRNSWRCRGCCRSGAWPLSLLCVGGRCGLPPVPVLSPWLPSVASGSPDGGGVLVSGAGPRLPARARLVLSPGGGLLLLPARGQQAGGSFCAGPRRPGPCAGWLPPVAWLWWSTGLLFPALPLNSPAHSSRGQPRQHRQQAPAASPKKEKHLETPYRPVAAVARAVPGVAVGSRGARCRAAAPCRDGRQHRTATAAYPRVRSASCKIHSSTERN